MTDPVVDEIRQTRLRIEKECSDAGIPYSDHLLTVQKQFASRGKSSETESSRLEKNRLPWRVVEVQPLDDFRLRVRFVDGLVGEVDMSALVNSATAGVFAQLADISIFNQVFVERGAVTWPGEIDLAPDSMHHEIKENGKWILT